MTLNEAIQMAARDLPYGWQIILRVERDAASIVLYDGDGEVVDDDTSPDLDLADKVEYAVSLARFVAGERGR